VRNFLALARQHPPERKSTALTEIIHGAVELLSYELRCDDVEVTVDVAPDVPVLWADAHQLHQVLVNLIANAHQAMRRQAPPRPGASAPAASPSAPFAPQRVLVVDGEVGVAEALAEMLGRDGHTVDVANDGARALELLGTGTYDVIVSDTRMPVLDGEAFYAELERRFPALCRRFIFLTGDVLNSDRRAFLARIGAPFLTKPCELDE